MSATVQLISAASGSVLLMLGVATRAGAALGRYEADLQHAAYTARLDRKRTTTPNRHLPSWPAEYTPPLPAPATTCPRPDETVPLTTVQPSRARHAKGRPTCT